MKRAREIPDWLVGVTFRHCWSVAQSLAEVKGSVCICILCFQLSQSLEFSSPPKMYDKVCCCLFCFQNLGTSCLLLKGCSSFLRSFLRFSLILLRSLEKDELIKRHHFNFDEMLCVCVYSVCCVVNPILSFPPKYAVIFSPEGAFWLLQSVLYYRRLSWRKGLSLLLPFSQGNLLKQSFQQQTPLTLIISGLDENTIFCRLWLKGENYQFSKINMSSI